MRSLVRPSLVLRILAAGGLLAIGLAATAAAQDAPPRKVAASLERIFGREGRTDSLRVDSSLVYRVSRGDSLLGYAQVRNVKGKDQPITVLVAIDPTGHLKDVDILVYREPYGGEVAYEGWRKQFRGKGPEDSIQIDRDIRSISGATISSHSVTRAVHQAVADFAAWHRDGRLP